MAIEVDVQNDKFPYLARQIQGDIAKAFGYGIDHVYETDQEFIDFISNFSIDTLYGEWLDQLGIVVGFPRPYIIKPYESFQFDNIPNVLDGVIHGFSTTDNVTIDNVQYDRNSGGILKDLYKNITDIPISDSLYKKYLYAITLLRNTHSIKNLATVLELFIASSRYVITFINNGLFVNDIIIYLAPTSSDYQDSLQTAFDKIFVTPPFVTVDVLLNFDDVYTVPEIENIIKEVTGADTGFSVTYTVENRKTIFTIVLDSSLAQYEDEVRIAVEAHFAGASDVIIVVEVE